MQEDPNYGRTSPGDTDGGAPPPGGGPAPGPGAMSAQDEKTWSMVAHLSVLVWPVTGFLPVAPLVIWLVYKDKSELVAFHALQSLWYQVAWLVIGTVGGFIATIFTILTLGFGIIIVVPVAIVLALIPFVHQLYAAYKVSQGVDYRYPFIADRIDGGRRQAL